MLSGGEFLKGKTLRYRHNAHIICGKVYHFRNNLLNEFNSIFALANIALKILIAFFICKVQSLFIFYLTNFWYLSEHEVSRLVTVLFKTHKHRLLFAIIVILSIDLTELTSAFDVI